jgi:urea transporter
VERPGGRPVASLFWEDGRVLDDAARRQLRFALFLQGFAALMMGVAFGVRVSAMGWDAVTVVLAAAFAVIVAAAVWTTRRLRAG